MHRPLRLLCFAGGLLLLGGCAVMRAPQPLPASAAGIEAFALSGRVAVKVERRGYSASLRWRHTAAGDSVRLLSPLGTVIAELESDVRGAILTTGDRKVHRSEDVQALTREILGWDLPLDGLQHWVLGRADPRMPIADEERDARERLTMLAQNEWRIVYLEYAGDSGLPARMALVHDRLSMRLLVDQWDFPQ